MLLSCSLLEKQSDVERWNLLLLWRNDTVPNKQLHYETVGLVGSDHEESQLCWSCKSCNFDVPAGNLHSDRTPIEAVCQFLFSRSRMGIIIQASTPDQDKRFPSFSHILSKVSIWHEVKQQLNWCRWELSRNLFQPVTTWLEVNLLSCVR